MFGCCCCCCGGGGSRIKRGRSLSVPLEYNNNNNIQLVSHHMSAQFETNRRCGWSRDQWQEDKRQKWVLSLFLKVGRAGSLSVSSDGRLLHTAGAEWQKARLLNAILTRSTCR